MDAGPCDRQAAERSQRRPRRREGARAVLPGEEDLVSRLPNPEEGPEVRRPRRPDHQDHGHVPYRQHDPHRQALQERRRCCGRGLRRVIVDGRRREGGAGPGCFHRAGGQDAEAEQGGDPAAGAVRGAGSQRDRAASVFQPVVGPQDEADGGRSQGASPAGAEHLVSSQPAAQE